MIFTAKHYRIINKYNLELIQNNIIQEKETYIENLIKLFYKKPYSEVVQNTNNTYMECFTYIQLLNKIEKSYNEYTIEMNAY
jgi:hypothetical protein